MTKNNPDGYEIKVNYPKNNKYFSRPELAEAMLKADNISKSLCMQVFQKITGDGYAFCSERMAQKIVMEYTAGSEMR